MFQLTQRYISLLASNGNNLPLELSKGFINFYSNWSITYLFCDEKDYELENIKIAPRIFKTFCFNGIGNSILDGILKMLFNQFKLYQELSFDIVKLLLALTSSNIIKNYIVSTNGYLSLYKMIFNDNRVFPLIKYPKKVIRRLVYSIIRCSSNVMISEIIKNLVSKKKIYF